MIESKPEKSVDNFQERLRDKKGEQLNLGY